MKKDEQLVLDADRGTTSAQDNMLCDSGSEVSESMHSSDEEEAEALITGSTRPVDDNLIDNCTTVDLIII